MSINLTKGQKISLKKEDGSTLSKVFMGLGWDTARGGGSIDLDASCVMFDEQNAQVDAVSFRQLKSRDGSVKHSGDNLTGAGDGDDETINVDLTSVPANVKSLVFTINSYQGQTFDKVENCFARLVDATNNTEICKYLLAEKGAHTGKIMAKVYRHNGEWKAAAIGAPANGRTIDDMRADIVSSI